MPYSKETDPDDILILAREMREEDRRELADGSGQTPIEALQEGYVNSPKILSIFDDDGGLVFICGVAPSKLDPLIGHPWLLATNRLDTIKKSFLKHSKEYLRFLGEGYPVLMNVCDSRNETHVKWLKWLGFSFIKRHPFNGVDFLEFVKLGGTDV